MAHVQIDEIETNKNGDNDEEMANLSDSDETSESDAESENSTEKEDRKPPSKNELIAAVNSLKNVSFNLVICFELLNSPLLVIEANVSYFDC